MASWWNRGGCRTSVSIKSDAGQLGGTMQPLSLRVETFTYVRWMLLDSAAPFRGVPFPLSSESSECVYA